MNFSPSLLRDPKGLPGLPSLNGRRLANCLAKFLRGLTVLDCGLGSVLIFGILIPSEQKP
jgi:hypothetical protein